MMHRERLRIKIAEEVCDEASVRRTEHAQSTACRLGYFFFGAYGARYLRGETDFGGEGLSDEQWVRAMEAVCRRAETIGFTNDSIGLHSGFDSERRAWLDLVKRGDVAAGIAIPHALLNASFPPERKLRYVIEDGAVLDFNPGPFLNSK